RRNHVATERRAPARHREQSPARRRPISSGRTPAATPGVDRSRRRRRLTAGRGGGIIAASERFVEETATIGWILAQAVDRPARDLARRSPCAAAPPALSPHLSRSPLTIGRSILA